MRPENTLQTLIDNRPNNLLLDAIRRLLAGTHLLDIATGYFEIGSLIDLDGDWQKADDIRLVMGGEMTRRTREQLVLALRQSADNGIDRARLDDDSRALSGLAAARTGCGNFLRKPLGLETNWESNASPASHCRLTGGTQVVMCVRM